MLAQGGGRGPGAQPRRGGSLGDTRPRQFPLHPPNGVCILPATQV